MALIWLWSFLDRCTTETSILTFKVAPGLWPAVHTVAQRLEAWNGKGWGERRPGEEPRVAVSLRSSSALYQPGGSLVIEGSDQRFEIYPNPAKAKEIPSA